MYPLLLIVSFYFLFQPREKKYYRYYYEKIDRLSKKVYDSIAFKDSVTAPNDSVGFARCFKADYKFRQIRSKLAFKDKSKMFDFLLSQDYKFTNAQHVDLNFRLTNNQINSSIRAVRAELGLL